MYKAFSDGACKGNPGPGGWGSIVETPEGDVLERYGNKASTTNNQMELAAAIEALRLTPAQAQVLITTDSQYVIKGITEWMPGWKRRNWQASTGGEVKNKELWMQLDVEVSQRKVAWEWVRGHTGHPQNERCDQLANQGVAELAMDTESTSTVKRRSSKPKTVPVPVASSVGPAAVVKSARVGPDPALGIDASFEL